MTRNESPMPDAEVVRNLLCERHEQWIALAVRVVRDRHEAEDVVQETIAAVWQRLPEIDPDKLPNYLSRAVRRNALKRRERRRDCAVLDGHDVVEPVARAAADSWDPLDLEAALEILPLSQQNVIRMKYYFGMTFREIGAALSISTFTAASRCRYALEKLRNFFQ